MAMTIYEQVDARKAIIDAVHPFEGHMLKQLQAYYRVGLTWTSNALEGNSLTEVETKVLLEDGLTAGGKPMRDTFEAIGHAQAYDYMFTLLRKKTITEDDAFIMHKMFYKNIDEQYAGRYRDKAVFIAGSKYGVCAASDIAKEMGKLFAWANSERGAIHPVEFAAQLHKRFVFIHPFIDGNGRLSRLLMNAALIRDGYMLAIIPPVLRQEYISLLERAHTDDRPFMDFIAERVLETSKDIMRLLNIQTDKN